MKTYNIVIDLLSDLCVSDGSVYNSLLDTDVCYDAYGIPYIPAKRIRGCLRECALELKDWGMDIDIAVLFGDKGSAGSAASVRIGNAYLQGSKELRDLAKQCANSVVMHPQNVLSAFTYVRTQTSVDQETGVADDASLRMMRVINKGLRFVAEVVMNENCYASLQKCCLALRRMGLARTRGLGEVSVRLENGKETDEQSHADYREGATKLYYEIELLEPVICKSLNGQESHTLDYIEGSKVLGMISQLLPGDYFEFMGKGKLRCSNAYLTADGVRYTEAPAYLFTIKNNSSNMVNKLYEQTAGKSERDRWDKEQKNQIKHCYYTMDGSKIRLESVLTEKRYHHRRPDDKSIGRAVSNIDNDADFYQMDSIAKEQCFAGFVEGSAEQIKEVYDLLTSCGMQYLGYSKTSEYGMVKIHVKAVELPAQKETVRSRKFAVTLHSPTIIYSEKAMATTDPGELRNEILTALGITHQAKNVTNYLRYTYVGGYNTTWNKRKPIMAAFDQGTTLVFEFDSEVEMTVDKTIWIGERTSEGYGESIIETISENTGQYVLDVIQKEQETSQTVFEVDDDLKAKLCEPLLDAFIRDRAIKMVNGKAKLRNNKDVVKPTVSNMLLMVKENSSLAAVREAVAKRYEGKSAGKEEKNKVAEEIISDVQNETVDLIANFENKYMVKGLNAEKELLEMKYMRAYLTQIKYMLRDSKGEKGNG